MKANDVTDQRLKKYDSLSCPDGQVEVQWRMRRVPGVALELAVVWTENGGREVKLPRRRGFGSRLLSRALDGNGEIRLDFDKSGLTCLMVISLDQPENPSQERRLPQIVPLFDRMAMPDGVLDNVSATKRDN